MHFRDLGAHISTGARLFGCTLNDRIDCGTSIASRLCLFSWDYVDKQAVVRTLVLPTALYGCEIAPYAIGAMGKLYTAIAKAIGPYSHASSNPMAYNLVEGPNLDPTEEVLVRRITLLRRMLAKHPSLQAICDHIFRHYAHAGAHGTITDPAYLDGLSPAPPGYAPYEPWKPTVAPPAGPIGLLLQQLFDNFMGMDVDWTIFDANQLQLDFSHALFRW